MLKRAYRRIPWLTTDLAIGATEFVYERLVKVAGMPPGRCTFATNGIPRLAGESIPTNVRAVFGIPHERAVLVSCSRADSYKRIDFVIRLVGRMVRAGETGVHFLYIGDGDALEELKTLAREQNVDSFCTFAGRRADVHALLAGCDIAIQPSAGEVGFSLSILEYMRAELPVLVSDNPSVCLATEHGRTGMIYRENDLAGAEQYLVELLQNPRRRKAMGVAAAKAIRERYDLESTHRQLIKALHRVI